MAAADSVDPGGWVVTFNDLMGRIAGRFGRVEPRRTATAYVRGLLDRRCRHRRRLNHDREVSLEY
ncbi:hypothetical protein GCM10010140_51340 [Streptosporangium pseudovulgare]|uniref:Transposase n=1 Tax=Streptosporangium pseudovulgare TaxID=35765 RepID=A0ABQ2R801_9ACTN|nr:hypothetical protein [Streptosporangium pseudovulgare]GGQ14772.1 hypothetical protein GCM10010140_51340 [Streptosporangium pseudovulgare]